MGNKYLNFNKISNNPLFPSKKKKPNPNSSPPNCINTTPPLPSQIQDPDDLRHVFDKFDTNGDGKISSDELESMLRCLGSSDPTEEAASMMQTADLDGDGYISFEEFLSVNQMETDAERCVEDLRNAFAVFDRDRNGLISAEELHHVLHGMMGETTTTLTECKSMIEAVDLNSDNAVNFEEFMSMMTRSLH